MEPTVVRTEWTALDTRVYNASIGIGDGPSDDHLLDHGSQRGGKMRAVAYPTLPLGMLHRNAPPVLAPWRAGAAVALQRLAKFDPAGLVHGDQLIVWEGRGEVPNNCVAEVCHDFAGIAQKRTGVVVSNMTTFTACSDSAAQTICTCVASMFLRKAKLTTEGEAAQEKMKSAPARGGSVRLAAVSGLVQRVQGLNRVDFRPLPPQVFQLSENQAALYAINGDDNPIHVDYAVAAGVGFKRPILHGLCTFGFAVRGLQRQAAAVTGAQPHEMCALACAARFSRPVLPGSTVVVQAAHVPDDKAGKVQVAGVSGTVVVLRFDVLACASGGGSTAHHLVISHGVAVFWDGRKNTSRL